MQLPSLRVATTARTSVHPIGRQIQAVLDGRDVGDGLLLVSVPHTTCAVTLNEPEPGLLDDLARSLERLVPWHDDYAHNRGSEDNAAAHVRAALLGHQLLVPVVYGRLQVGVWQDVLLVEWTVRAPARLSCAWSRSPKIAAGSLLQRRDLGE